MFIRRLPHRLFVFTVKVHANIVHHALKLGFHVVPLFCKFRNALRLVVFIGSRFFRFLLFDEFGNLIFDFLSDVARDVENVVLFFKQYGFTLAYCRFTFGKINLFEFIRRREHRPYRFITSDRNNRVAFLVAVQSFKHTHRNERLQSCSRVTACGIIRIGIDRELLDFLLSAKFRKLFSGFAVVRANKNFDVAICLYDVPDVPAVLCGQLRIRLQHKQKPYAARTRYRYHSLDILEFRKVRKLV